MNCRLYRCGWCGSITKPSGENLQGEEFEKAKRIIDKYGDVRTTLVNGFCCGHEAMNY